MVIRSYHYFVLQPLNFFLHSNLYAIQEIILAYTRKRDSDLLQLFISVTILNKRCDFIIYQYVDDFVKTQQHTSTHRKRWIVNIMRYLKIL